MKRIIMEELEKQRILKMHESQRLLMFEQANTTTTVDPKLQYLRDSLEAGCLGPKENGRLRQDPTTNKYFFRTTTKSGKVVEFFADMTYSFQDGSKKGTWKCDVAAYKQKKAEEDKKAQEKKTAETTNISRTKEEGDWKERKDIPDTDENLENTRMYEKKVVNGVTLYRSVPGSGIAGGLTDNQKNIIDSWVQKGYKLKKDLKPLELQTWKPQVVSPATEGYFNQDLVMYYDPTQVKGASSADFEEIITNQSIDRDDCRNNIEAYWNAYKKKIKVDPASLNSKKEVIKACRDQHRGKWGVLGAGKKWDSILDLLSNRLQAYDGFKAPKNTNQSNWSLD